MEESRGLEQAASKARSFYTNSFNFLRNRPPASNPSGKIPINLSYGCTTPSCQYHGNGPPCRNGPLILTCGQRVTRTNGVVTCTFSYLSPDLVVVPFGHLIDPVYDKAGFYLRARPEDSRDLVICPVQHTTNTALARSAPFWKCVIQTLTGFVTLARQPQQPQQPQQPSSNTLCDGIALNFGIWETENAKEVSKGVVQFATDCHGHAHILLSPTGFTLLERHPQFKGLYGRFRHPDLHLREDCDDLQKDRLLTAENSLLRHEVGTLSNRMTGLENSMADIRSMLLKMLSKQTE